MGCITNLRLRRQNEIVYIQFVMANFGKRVSHAILAIQAHKHRYLKF
jgi:hypothetical protein